MNGLNSRYTVPETNGPLKTLRPHIVNAGRRGATMIKVTLKDDDGRVIQSMVYPLEASVAHRSEPEKSKDKEVFSLAGLCGKAIKNLIVNQIKDKYFGGLL